jgi:hypothetical protein
MRRETTGLRARPAVRGGAYFGQRRLKTLKAAGHRPAAKRRGFSGPSTAFSEMLQRLPLENGVDRRSLALRSVDASRQSEVLER